MHDIRPKRATYADILAAPPNMVAELFDGVLYTMPRPRPKHTRAYSRLGMVIGAPFDLGSNGPGGWCILDEPELHLGEDVAVPDLAGWHVERMPVQPETAFYETTPDWVCEILSPSTRRLDQVIKREVYARHGVSHLWHLDPEAKLLEVFELAGGKWLLLRTFTDGDDVAAAPFAALTFRLGQVLAV